MVDRERGGRRKREQRGGGETRGELKASHSLSSPALLRPTVPASHRAASCTANVPFPLRPRTFPPLQCPPLPGPTRPSAPLCERRLLPDLASSSVLSPTQKIRRGDPKKHFSGMWFGLLVYNCPSERCHLGSSCLEWTGAREELD